MKGALFAVSENCTRVERIVFNYLFGFLRRDLMEGDVIDIAVIPAILPGFAVFNNEIVAAKWNISSPSKG